jgi:hypothetical protein
MEPASKNIQSSGQGAQDNLMGIASQAAGLALLNAVSAQQQGYTIGNATVTMTVTRILAGQAPPEDTANATAAKLAPPPPAAPLTPNAVASEANFAMIAQAWAIAAQDAAAYLRYVEIIAAAAMGMALEAITKGGAGGDPDKTIAAAQSIVANAERNLEQISAQAGELMKDFPRAL